MVAKLLVLTFNCAMCEGLPNTWSLSTIVPIFKLEDPMEIGNDHTIMIRHTLAWLYATILEQQLSRWAKREGVQATKQPRFRGDFSTLDHILTLKAIIEEGRSHGRWIYCSFADFHKAFDIVPKARLMCKLQGMGVSTD